MHASPLFALTIISLLETVPILFFILHAIIRAFNNGIKTNFTGFKIMRTGERSNPGEK